jgi:hypothetical protein
MSNIDDFQPIPEPTPVAQPKPPKFLLEKPSRDEMFKIIGMATDKLAEDFDKMFRPTADAVSEFLPYHAVVLSLVIEKLGITEAEIDAHRERLLLQQKAEDAALIQFQQAAQEVIDTEGENEA